MRLFEFIITGYIGWGLYNFIFFSPSKKLQTKIYLTVFLSLSLVHVFAEHYRWQMVPLYILGLALGLFLNGRNQSIAVKTIFLTLFIISSFLPIAIPIITLPVPSGKYSIGSTINHWVDQKRMEWFTDEIENDKRQLMVQFWYPGVLNEVAVKDQNIMPYLDHLSLRAETLGEAGNFPGCLVKHLNLVKTNSYVNLAVNSDAALFPVVILSHGITGMRQLHTSLAEKLASEGYVVVAPDHSYDANIAIFPDGSIADYRSEITGFPDSVNIRRSQIQTRAADISYIIDQLESIQSGLIRHPLNGYLDLGSIGITGHSYGGGTSALAAAYDDRIKAVSTMDSWMNPVPKNVVNSGISQPFLYMGRPTWDDSDYPSNDSIVREIINNNKGPSFHITIKNTRHLNFSDAPLFSPFIHHILETGKMDRKKSVQLINQISVEFFNQYLRDKKSLILSGEVKPKSLIFHD